MTLRFIKPALSVLVFTLVLLCSCRKEVKPGYTLHPAGYYYQLLAFSNDQSAYHPGYMAFVSAVFKTQSDSVFWDSYNDLNDRLYIKTDTAVSDLFRRHVSHCAEGDSVSLLLSPAEFFSWQFNSDSIPFFSRVDTVVKISFKIKKLLSPEEFKTTGLDLLKEERRRISGYFRTDRELEMARDPLGFYRIERPVTAGDGPTIMEGDFVKISYEGTYLNGRYLERSKDDFEFMYGTPDQLLRGLNYVIGKLKLGQNAKILLPSRLAFGENGSSNGIVPPFTPLVYKIKIIEVKSIK